MVRGRGPWASLSASAPPRLAPLTASAAPRLAPLTASAAPRLALGALAGVVIGACSVNGSIGGGSSASTGSGADGGGGTTSTPVTGPRPFDKIDLILAVDNARSMAEKQQILGDALIELVHALADPPCVDDLGQPVADQPSGPLEPCPAGSTRQLAPILDLHVG